MYLKYLLLKSWTLTRNSQTTITSALNSHKNVQKRSNLAYTMLLAEGQILQN